MRGRGRDHHGRDPRGAGRRRLQGDGPLDLSALRRRAGPRYRDGDRSCAPPTATASPTSTSSRRRTSRACSTASSTRPAREHGDHRDQPGLPLRLHVLRLGLGHALPHPQVRPRPGLRRARVVRAERGRHDRRSPTPTSASSSATSRSPRRSPSSRAHGYPQARSAPTTPRTRVKHLEQIVEELADAGILSYGLLSLQTMDADTLNTIHRSNIKVEKYEELAAEFRRADLPLYVDLMMGLPGPDARRRSQQRPAGVHQPRGARQGLPDDQLLVNSPMNEPSYRASRTASSTEPGEAGARSRPRSPATTTRRCCSCAARCSSCSRTSACSARSPATSAHETGHARDRLLRRASGATRAADARRWPMIELRRSGALPRYDGAAGELGAVPRRGPALPWSTSSASRTTTPSATVLAVQHALLPARHRQFPLTLSLPHDYVAWHAAMMTVERHDGRHGRRLAPRSCQPLRRVRAGDLHRRRSVRGVPLGHRPHRWSPTSGASGS